jgi:hypothetical protein
LRICFFSAQLLLGLDIIDGGLLLKLFLTCAFIGAALGCGLRIERAARNCGVKSANTTDVGHTVILSFLDAGERRPRILHPYKFAGSSVE